MRCQRTVMCLALVFAIMPMPGWTSGVPTGEGGDAAIMPSGYSDLEKFLGTWALVSYEVRRKDGTVIYPFGPKPQGQLMYDSTGHMSANLMNPDRPNFASGERAVYTEEEIRAAWTGYVGYAGTFTLNVAAGTVTHHVKVASFPNWVGSEQVRQYEFSQDGQQLLLSAPVGPGARAYLLWERAETFEP